MIFLKNDITPEERINKVVNKLSSGRSTETAKRLCKKLNDINGGKEESVIMPLSLVADTIETIMENPKNTMSTYYSDYNKAEDIYKKLFVYGENTREFEGLRVAFLKLFEEGGPIDNDMFDMGLLSSFTDKSNYFNLVNVLAANPHPKEVFAAIKDYGVQIREYMLGDESFLSNLCKVSVKLGGASLSSYQEIIKSETVNIERMNGIYDIDPVRLLEVEKSVNSASAIVNRAYDILKNLELKRQQIEDTVNVLSREASEIEKTTDVALSLKADKAKERIEQTIAEYEASQKRAVIAEKDILLKEVFSDAQSKLNEYRDTAKAITNTTAVEIASLNKDADRIYKKVNDIVNNDSTVKDILKRASEDEAIVEKFNKLSMLNNENIQAIGKTMTAEISGYPEYSERKAVFTEGYSEAVEERIMPVNPLLDSNVEFSKRYALVMKEKERRIASGELFHEKFDDVLVAVMEDANPYLIGPSGCGKTYMVGQIASLLNMEYTDIGYINEEYDILGFVTASGRYSPSNFYRCYKYGEIAFCDELDNGNSRATVKLNSFLSNKRDASYCFPGGERVKRHPSFRVVGAGNTEGNGGDINYNAREKIEESVQQRLLPIYVGYDNRVEKAILKDYPEWFDFVCLFRMATDKWTQVSGMEAPGILSTRDTARIKRYLENGSFTDEKILVYEFIQTKDSEYLEFLDQCMGEALEDYKEATKLYSLFHEQVMDKSGK